MTLIPFLSSTFRLKVAKYKYTVGGSTILQRCGIGRSIYYQWHCSQECLIDISDYGIIILREGKRITKKQMFSFYFVLLHSPFFFTDLAIHMTSTKPSHKKFVGITIFIKRNQMTFLHFCKDNSLKMNILIVFHNFST